MKKILSELNYLLSTVYEKILALFILRTSIQTPVETAEAILLHKKSLVRFGDGELEWLKENHSANFQRGNKKLAHELKKIIRRDDEGLLVGLPNSILSQKDLSISEKKWWRKWLARNLVHFNKIIYKKNFASTFFSRPYIMYQNANNASLVFPIMKKIFKDRDIIIIEGELSRFGVGNDLLDDTIRVRRIIGPSTNAFEKKETIKKYITNNITKYDNILFLVSLGPTATVLAADLFDSGYQAIDIGHADLEYEWYRMGVNDKVNLKFKGVNEVAGGYKVDQLPSNLETKYRNEIIEVIK